MCLGIVRAYARYSPISVGGPVSQGFRKIALQPIEREDRDTASGEHDRDGCEFPPAHCQSSAKVRAATVTGATGSGPTRGWQSRDVENLLLSQSVNCGESLISQSFAAAESVSSGSVKLWGTTSRFSLQNRQNLNSEMACSTSSIQPEEGAASGSCSRAFLPERYGERNRRWLSFGAAPMWSRSGPRLRQKRLRWAIRPQLSERAALQQSPFHRTPE